MKELVRDVGEIVLTYILAVIAFMGLIWMATWMLGYHPYLKA